MTERLYFDHAATTPPLPCAIDAMADAARRWGNASSPHAEGRQARAMLEQWRARAKSALNFDGELLFTSGATEAIDRGVRQSRTGLRWASTVEHQAVLRAGVDETLVPVNADGQVDLARLEQMLDAARGEGLPPLLAVQHANNITGIVQNIAAIAAIVHGAGGWLLVDAAQSAAKLPLPPQADMIAISAHKFGGVAGAGALLLRDLSLLEPVGGQERGYRPGTENLAAIAAMVAALEHGGAQDAAWLADAAQLRAYLDAEIRASGGMPIGAAEQRIPTIAAYHMPGVAAQTQIMRFDMAGIAVSATSACSQGGRSDNYVLEAMGWSPMQANDVIRIGIGRDTDKAGIDRLIHSWRTIAGDLMRAA